MHEIVQAADELPHLRSSKEGLTDHELSHGGDELVESFERVVDQLATMLGAASDFYVELASDPDGPRPPECRDLIERLAVVARDVDVDHRLVVALADRREPAPTIRLLRSMQHGLVLRLSGDPGRRALAIPIEELGGRTQPVFLYWKAQAAS